MITSLFQRDLTIFYRTHRATMNAGNTLNARIGPFRFSVTRQGNRTGRTDLRTDAARDTGAIVTAEEHSVIGGLGGAVSEVVCETIPVPVVKVGVEDVFGRSGPAVELLHIHGLDAENIVKKAKQALELKAAR